MSRSFLLLALVALLAHTASANHGTDGGEQCACIARDHGWTLNCANSAFLSQAFMTLEDNNCAASCGSETCAENFYIVQFHHDRCGDQLPDHIAHGFHQYEDVCQHCTAPPPLLAGRPTCPTIDCSNASPLNEALLMLDGNTCATDCSSSACETNYQILQSYFDTCTESIRPSGLERLHEFEDACAAIRCNAPGATSTVTCTESFSPASPLSPVAPVSPIVPVSPVAPVSPNSPNSPRSPSPSPSPSPSRSSSSSSSDAARTSVTAFVAALFVAAAAVMAF